MSKNSTSKAISRSSLFGPPPVLEGEDSAAYDELFGRVCAAVKPVDVIDEMLSADVVASEWEALRWRRLKLSLIRALGFKALRRFLRENFDYDLYQKHFTDELTTILQDNLAIRPKILHRLWRTSVPRMNLTPSTGSIKFWPASV